MNNSHTPHTPDVASDAVNSRKDSTANEFVSHENTGAEQAAGTVGGAAVGAAWGMLAGPIGSIVGGLAGAVGGWWAARSATEQHVFNADDDTVYRTNFDQRNAKRARTDIDVTRTARTYSYDDVRPAYQTGHLAGNNPDYASRAFDDVEPELRSAYMGADHDNWDDVRDYARDGYDRGRSQRDERGGMPTSAQIDASTGKIRDAI